MKNIQFELINKMSVIRLKDGQMFNLTDLVIHQNKKCTLHWFNADRVFVTLLPKVEPHPVKSHLGYEDEDGNFQVSEREEMEEYDVENHPPFDVEINDIEILKQQ